MPKDNNTSMQKKIKKSLLIQSLSPIAVFTLLMKIPVNFFGDGFLENFKKFFTDITNIYVIFAIGISIIWILYTIICCIKFNKFTENGATITGRHVKNYIKDEESSLSFYVTFIVPLLMNDFGSLNSLIFYYLIIIFLGYLLSRTSIFYKNPVLTLLKYNIYELEFVTNGTHSEIPTGKIIGITRSKLTDKSTVIAKKIYENIYFIKSEDVNK